MIISHFIIVFFKLVNFGIILFLGAYLFKRYVVPSIRAQMQADTHMFASLQKSYHMLMRHYQLLDKEIEDDRYVQADLKQKIMRWRAHLKQKERELEDERVRRTKRLAHLVARQEKEISTQLLYQQILPTAVNQARDQLEKEFAQESAQEQYLNRVMHKIAQGRS